MLLLLKKQLKQDKNKADLDNRNIFLWIKGREFPIPISFMNLHDPIDYSHLSNKRAVANNV